MLSVSVRLTLFPVTLRVVKLVLRVIFVPVRIAWLAVKLPLSTLPLEFKLIFPVLALRLRLFKFPV
jgi:hypothetical protein